jgi:hypothetical protein
MSFNLRSPKLFVAGQWIETATKSAVRNPFNGETVTEVSVGDEST